MDRTEALHLAELLSSRLCHDLVGPVGAVRSGVELISEFGGDPDPEAMELIATSANSSAARLQFFRLAYGLAGARADVPLTEAARMAGEVIGSRRTRLDWPAEHTNDALAPAAGGIKVLLNVVLLASEALPRGGTVQVRLAAVGGRMRFRVTASANDARLDEDARAAMSGEVPVAELSARTGSRLLHPACRDAAFGSADDRG